MRWADAGRPLVLVVALLAQVSCGNDTEHAGATARQGTAGAVEGGGTAAATPRSADATTQPASALQAKPPGTRARIGVDGRSILFCGEADRLDTAMDLARYGQSRLVLNMMRDPVFFNVTGPVEVEVRDSDTKSRWPKVLLRLLDGDSAGKTGWVVLSEVKELEVPAK